MLGWAALFKEFDTDGSGSTRVLLPSRLAPALLYTMLLEITELGFGESVGKFHRTYYI